MEQSRTMDVRPFRNPPAMAFLHPRSPVSSAEFKDYCDHGCQNKKRHEGAAGNRRGYHILEAISVISLEHPRVHIGGRPVPACLKMRAEMEGKATPVRPTAEPSTLPNYSR